MIIVGEKVRLRALEASDSNLLRELMNDAETEYMLGGWSFPISEIEQSKWLEAYKQSTNLLRVMIDVNEQTIGTAILSDIDYKNGVAQIHIKLTKGDGRHKGYGTDTINTLVRYAFSELRLHCIYAQVIEHNTISRGLFRKCGFEEEGIMRARVFKAGNYINVYVLSKLNSVGACDA